MTLEHIDTCQLPTQWGTFQLHGFRDSMSDKEHLALSIGSPGDEQPVLIRMHSECLTGDALFSQRCDCGAQLEHALAVIAAKGSGILLYLRQEGRGIGLLNKIRAYHLQDEGADTVDANEALGFEADQRDYSIALPMLQYFGVTRVEILTNNPRKIEALTELGIEVVKRHSIETGLTPHNSNYLKTKSTRLGHLLS
ncbi:GTP cyclohydrolase II [Litorivicinus sp.]|jgi:GTP cyclohydrolase II|nr:GTP cyclohydrolase II [Litorivicinus sp.]MDB9862049.1 GTP cyclohydrolase II [Litorivicinus sp.]MDC1208206.1 GTP cyclohydrolase II [Litorivicinus sp.]MDC1319625.1 GTP cyclohydrolase II [Litorivicinus sp.]